MSDNKEYDRASDRFADIAIRGIKSEKEKKGIECEGEISFLASSECS